MAILEVVMRSVPPGPPGGRGLERDPALVPLSRDHHFALRQAFWMRRAAGAPDMEAATRVARDYLTFHRDELVPHIADEEEILFPAFEPFDREGTQRLRREHHEIHALTSRLRSRLEEAGDPRTLMAELASLIDDHVRYEERAYFMAVQERLPSAVLEAVGARIALRPRAYPTG
ncbi:MAG TPA: hemerythrin domain-containing protein [Vicinamibacteria bacterium]|nr:hemerythrin domain-containing protein [Vicinamibacteria bacterium]